MPPVLLDPKPQTKRPAREIVIATRLPDPPKEGTYRTPFDAEGDIVVECDNDLPDGRPCGWGCSGPRAQVGLAVRQHHRLFHSDQTGVVLLNAPRQ